MDETTSPEILKILCHQYFEGMRLHKEPQRKQKRTTEKIIRKFSVVLSLKRCGSRCNLNPYKYYSI